jgi:hypothetical protein
VDARRASARVSAGAQTRNTRAPTRKKRLRVQRLRPPDDAAARALRGELDAPPACANVREGGSSAQRPCHATARVTTTHTCSVRVTRSGSRAAAAAAGCFSAATSSATSSASSGARSSLRAPAPGAMAAPFLLFACSRARQPQAGARLVACVARGVMARTARRVARR